MHNILFCITGPSGSGKTSIMKEIMDNEVGSCTSRQMRKGEVQGREYNFISKEEFLKLIGMDELAEFTEYSGNYYGTTKDELIEKLDRGHAYVICDNHGFHQFNDCYDRVVSIFLYADPDDCAENMYGRGDSIENVNKRLVTYEKEIANRGQYDYVVKNIRGNRRYTIETIAWIVSSEIKKGAILNEYTEHLSKRD
jgi:guanylate kinase